MSLPFQTANLPGLLVHDRDRPHSSFHTDRFSIAERNVDRPYTDPGYKPYNALHEPSRDPRFAPLEAQDPVRRSLFPLMVDEGMPTVLPAPSQTISQMLPPRRELPFPRLAPKPSTTGALNSVPGEIEDTVSGPDNAPSVALDQRAPTAVERPPPQSKSNSKSKKPRTVNSKKQQPPSKVPSQNLQSTATPDKHDESEIVRPADTNTTAVKRAPAPKTTKRAAPAKKTAVTLRSFATQTTPEPQPKSTRSFGTQVLITSLKGALIPSEEQGGWAEAINTFIEKYKDFQPRESHQTTNSTEAVVAGVRNYAEQDEEKRKAELEAILRGLIEEEGFEELVEEVDATCKRMGLTL